MRLLVTVLSLLCAASPLHASTAGVDARAAVGNPRGLVPCSECHDRNGKTQPTGGAIAQLAALRIADLRLLPVGVAGSVRADAVVQPRALQPDGAGRPTLASR